MDHFLQGKKDGLAARKKHKGEVPPPKIAKNSYGDRKVNQEFERIVKAAMEPYLKKD